MKKSLQIFLSFTLLSVVWGQNDSTSWYIDVNNGLKTDNNVGIGMFSNPSYRLGVNGQSRFMGDIYINKDNQLRSLYFKGVNGNSLARMYATDNAEMWFLTSPDITQNSVDQIARVNSDGFYVKEGGIGIGTFPTNDYKLLVNGDTRLDGKIGVGTAPRSTHVYTQLGDSYIEGSVNVTGQLQAWNAVGLGGKVQSGINLTVYGQSDFKGDTRIYEDQRIDGNLGIGNNPSSWAKLNVFGHSQFEQGHIYLKSFDMNNPQAFVFQSPVGDITARMTIKPNGNLVFGNKDYIDSNAVFGDRLTIQTDGQVKINALAGNGSQPLYIDNEGNIITQQESHNRSAGTTSSLLLPSTNWYFDEGVLTAYDPTSPPAPLDKPTTIKVGENGYFSGWGNEAVGTTGDFASITNSLIQKAGSTDPYWAHDGQMGAVMQLQDNKIMFMNHPSFGAAGNLTQSNVDDINFTFYMNEAGNLLLGDGTDHELNPLARLDVRDGDLVLSNSPNKSSSTNGNIGALRFTGTSLAGSPPQIQAQDLAKIFLYQNNNIESIYLSAGEGHNPLFRVSSDNSAAFGTWNQNLNLFEEKINLDTDLGMIEVDLDLKAGRNLRAQEDLDVGLNADIGGNLTVDGVLTVGEVNLSNDLHISLEGSLEKETLAIMQYERNGNSAAIRHNILIDPSKNTYEISMPEFTSDINKFVLNANEVNFNKLDSLPTAGSNNKILTINSDGALVPVEMIETPIITTLWEHNTTDSIITTTGGSRVGIGFQPGNYSWTNTFTDFDDVKLAVKGQVVATGLKVVEVDHNSWPDYVFEKSYKRTSLEDLEEEIFKNKHLPGIPSAMEIATKGQDVAKIQAKLLEKIEELTLHVIDLNKQNKSLSNEKSELEDRLAKIETALFKSNK